MCANNGMPPSRRGADAAAIRDRVLRKDRGRDEGVGAARRPVFVRELIAEGRLSREMDGARCDAMRCGARCLGDSMFRQRRVAAEFRSCPGAVGASRCKSATDEPCIPGSSYSVYSFSAR